MSNAESSSGSPSAAVWNVPNTLSFARLLLSLLVGLLIEFQFYLPAMIVFLVAASTDFVDGWWARRFDQVTKLGRLLDPFVDKIIITAALIALVGEDGSGIAAWMATLIIGRELLVTTLRAMVEGQGGDFSARSLGKWKMVAQCAAIVASLLWLSYSQQEWLYWSTVALVWLALLLTVISAVDYVIQAIKLSKS